ncbi:MAG: LysM peptidoglycan-binding domain-containing protein [Pseudomonadota bacterium]|nr:LysM peptidoglycan-binding domain-containing protein [Pseudomonadota bacterium]
MRRWPAYFSLVLALPSAAFAAEGTATLPLDQWEGLLDAVEAAATRVPPPVPVLQVDRLVEGAFRRGVFTGTLTTRFVVPPGQADIRVPILDQGASIASVELDGKTTSLLSEAGFYTVAIDTPGAHTLRVAFFVGREDDRFARRLQLALPAAGPTRLTVWVPEEGIEAELAQGGVTALRSEAGGTRIEGQLDGRGAVDLAWKGQLQQAAGPVKLEAEEFAILTLHEALVRGVAVIDASILEGETDRIVLRVPEDVEIVDVLGDAVLQWQTEPGRVVVLLRYLVADSARVRVQFQFPVDLEQPVELKLPLPEEGVPFRGAIGVLGPAGLRAEVRSAEGAEALRDLPAELAALTTDPLLVGFDFHAAPAVVLNVARQAEVELTTTIVDNLEASTVLIEDGAEITKVQLRVRNSTRQYLSARLPPGAVLTHARIDGRPVRPALVTDAGGEALLFPLVQSERFAAGQTQTWTVREGDTLGGIADRFYSDPGQWSAILDGNNDQLGSPLDLAPGQQIRIPPRPGVAVQESSFVIELAWTRAGPEMGWLGRRELTLPELDADVLDATWHVYVPDALVPLSFDANLTQYSDIRYDHLRRVRQFLDAAFGGNDAWAGGGYESILSRRKSIYQEEASRMVGAQEATSSFPLVGERYRFKRLLPGREVPTLSVTWLSRSLVPGVRWAGFTAAFALALAGLRGGRRLGIAAGFAGLLVVAWYVEGVHRRIVWGVDVALIVSLVGALRARAAVRSAESGGFPGRRAIGDLVRLGTLGRIFLAVVALYLVLMVPLLWSTIALVVLALLARRSA